VSLDQLEKDSVFALHAKVSTFASLLFGQ